MPPLVAIADFMDPTGEAAEYLAGQGLEIRVGSPLWETRELPPDELIDLVGDADAIIGGGRERFPRAVLEACPRTRCVVKYGIGTDRIDTVAATELGILVANTPIVPATRAVGEHTMALLLGLTRRIQPIQRRARAGAWRIADLDDASEDLYGKTVGIVGLGRIGSTVARMLTPFGVTLIATDPYRDDAWFASAGVARVPLDELLERSDIVSLHVPATDETRKLIDAAALARMKPTAYLVNTSRGVVVDTEALIDALDHGVIAGAGLDVLDPEPPDAGSPLFARDNVVVTTHIASFTPPSVSAQMRAAADAVLAILRGEQPEHVVNPEVLLHRRGAGQSLL
jgi:phosphoglycerate dehydrogenase-like enzyme